MIGRDFIYKNYMCFNVMHMITKIANYVPNMKLTEHEERRALLGSRKEKEVTVTLDTLCGHWMNLCDSF